jgi:HSP20 family molecular chaperone IbpA
MKKIFQNKIVVGIVSFILGMGALYGAQRIWAHSSTVAYNKSPDINSFYDNFFNEDFFDKSRDPISQMKVSVGDIKLREDEKNIYYDISIAGIDPKNVDVKVENNEVYVTGKVERKSDTKDEDSYFSSSFHREFPVPANTDSRKVEIENEKNKVTLKFPKV